MTNKMRTTTLERKNTNLLAVFKKNAIAWLMIAPCVMSFVLFVWGPILQGMWISLFQTKGFETVKFIGLGNYISVVKDSLFLKSLSNSVKYVLWSLIIGLPLPILTAIAINELFRGKGFFKFAVYLPAMVPAIAASLLWTILYEPSAGGLLNMFISKIGIEPFGWLQNDKATIPLIVITMTWGGFGSTTLLYLANLQSVNQELYEAAELDGAGIFRKCFNITFPHMKGLILTLAIMQIINVFNIFQQPLAMTGGGPNNASITLTMTAYNYAFQYFQTGRASAVSVLTGLMLMIFSIIYFKVQKDDEV